MLAQVRLNSVSGLFEDVVINTWSFDCDTDDATLEGVGEALHDFYSVLDTYLQSTIDTSGHEVRWYNRADAEPRTPVNIWPFALTPNTSNLPMPREVAVCLSFAAAPASGASNARRRGRIYFGPLNTTATVSSGAYVRPNTAFMNELLDQYVILAATANNDFGAAHEVWSGVDSVGRHVTRAWVDNEWDTQRRRGVKATTRVSAP